MLTCELVHCVISMTLNSPPFGCWWGLLVRTEEEEEALTNCWNVSWGTLPASFHICRLLLWEISPWNSLTLFCLAGCNGLSCTRMPLAFCRRKIKWPFFNWDSLNNELSKIVCELPIIWVIFCINYQVQLIGLNIDHMFNPIFLYLFCNFKNVFHSFSSYDSSCCVSIRMCLQNITTFLVRTFLVRTGDSWNPKIMLIQIFCPSQGVVMWVIPRKTYPCMSLMFMLMEWVF